MTKVGTLCIFVRPCKNACRIVFSIHRLKDDNIGNERLSLKGTSYMFINNIKNDAP